MTKKAILIIMDGWGQGNGDQADAIHQANTPYIDSLYANESVGKALLDASGKEVGLPEGQMGNSEVGHMNIGAGRVVYQDLVKINKAVEDNSILQNAELNQAFDYAIANDKQVHLIGLVSDGGVHSSMQHLFKLCDMATQKELQKVYVHALTDGRDTDPKSGIGFIKELDDYLQNTNAQIASICGRYYTMDRDKRWERVKVGYDLMVHGKGHTFTNPIAAMQTSYNRELTDEFVEPSVMVNPKDGKPIATIQKDDVVICFNFRTDRLREITTVLSQEDRPEYEMKTIPLQYFTMTRYDENFRNVQVIYDKEDLKDTMGEVVSKMGLKQLRIAETEKYPHVTFFFSGGRDEPFEGEDRIMVSSPKVATYDMQPEMSAQEVTEKVVQAIETEDYSLIVLNFANSDMVGHTGIYTAITKAIETVDRCVGKVIDSAKAHAYSILLTADHGNSDFAVNADGSPNTAHSLNKVPVFVIKDGNREELKIKDGRLADIAPTLMGLMGVEPPEIMTGRDLGT